MEPKYGEKKIFISRLSLKFKDKNLEKIYESMYNSEIKVKFNYFLSILSLIIAIINILISRVVMNEYLFAWNLIIYLGLGLNCGILILQLLISLSIINFPTSSGMMANFFLSTNFLILYVNIFFFFSYWKSSSIDAYMFILVNLVSTKLLFFSLELFSLLQIILTLITIFSVEIIMIIYNKEVSSIVLIFTFLMSNIIVLFNAYLKEVKSKMNFFISNHVQDTLLKELEKLLSFRKMWEEYNNCLMSIDTDLQISYMNKSMSRLVKQFYHEEREDCEELGEIPSKTNYSNYFKFFSSNCLCETISELPKERKNCEEFLSCIFSNISFVNEDLFDQNKDLHNYLSEFEQNNYNKTGTLFSLEKFSDLLHRGKNFYLPKQSQKDLSAFNQESMLKTEFIQLLDQEKSKNDSIIKINNKIVESKTQNSFDNKKTMLYLFRTQFKKERKEQDFLVFCLVLNNNLCFFLEDKTKILLKERNEIVNVCKSLYLSKISHELKNPMCNLLEIFSLIEGDLKYLEKCNKLIKTDMNNMRPVITFPSSSSSSDKERINSESSSPLDKKFATSFNSLKSNLSNLKCLSDMMFQILNDFNFYTNLFHDGSNNSNLPKQSKTSLHERSNSPKRKSKNNLTKISNRLVSKNYLNISGECNYLEVILNIIKIFTSKIQLDQKVSCLSFVTRFEKHIPQQIEIDKEIFQALFFNLIYHIYKTVASGSVLIMVNFISRSNLSISKSSQIKFEIIIKGQIGQNNLPDNLDDLMKMDSPGERMKTIQERGSSSEIDESFHIERVNTIRSNFTVDNFHLKQIFNVTNLSKRNILIDNFNTKFHYYLSIFFSAKLGINLKYDCKSESKESSILFYIDYKPRVPINHSYRPNFNSDKNFSSDNSEEETNRNKNLEIKTQNIRKDHTNSISPETLRSPIAKINDSFSTKNTQKKSDEMLFNYIDFIRKDSLVKKICKDAVHKQLQSTSSMIHKKHSKSLILKSSSSPNIRKNFETIIISHTKVHPQAKKRMSVSVNRNSKESFEYKFFKAHQRRATSLLSSGLLNSFQSSFVRMNSPTLKEIDKDETVRVLLCDDENLIKKTLHRFLNLFSKDSNLIFDIQHADNGFECLNKIHSYYTMGKYFDLLIIDETMPIFKGSQIIHLLKSSIEEGNFRELIIISFTSYSSSDKIEYILSQGADFVLNKPLRYEGFKDFLVTNVFK